MNIPEIPKVEIPEKGWFVNHFMNILAGDDDKLYWALTGENRKHEI